MRNFLWMAMLVWLWTTSFVQAGPVYFLVAEFPGQEVHHDSYVLPLDDPVAIAHARELIALGAAAEARLVTARIAEGADGINRDYRQVGQPEWSWHVTKFLGFADATIEILDGWPTFVESDVPAWNANTQSMIGFWTYTVVEELPAVPEPSSAGLCVMTAATVLGIRFVRQRSGPHFC